MEKIAIANHWIGTLDEITLDTVAVVGNISEDVSKKLPNNYMFDDLEPMEINYKHTDPNILADLANTKKINIAQSFEISQLKMQLDELKKLYNNSIKFTKPETEPKPIVEQPKAKIMIVKPVKVDIDNDPEVLYDIKPIQAIKTKENRKILKNLFDQM